MNAFTRTLVLSGLAMGVAIAVGGCGGGGNQGGTPTAPAAPSNLHVTAFSDTSISLAWTDNSNNETGFELERSTTGEWEYLVTLAPNTTSYTDVGLQPGTGYQYRVRALGNQEDSAWSAPVSQTTSAQPTLATVRGRIVSPYLSTPISGATVTIDGVSGQAVTGDDGLFAIPNVPTGPRTLRVTAAFYRLPGGSLSITVTEADTNLGDIIMEPHTEGPPPPPF